MQVLVSAVTHGRFILSIATINSELTTEKCCVVVIVYYDQTGILCKIN